jgi:hypothetical protein
MQHPNHLRKHTRKCRTLAKTVIEPELIEQLRVWSIELADQADSVERRPAEREETVISNSKLIFRPSSKLSDRLTVLGR